MVKKMDESKGKGKGKGKGALDNFFPEAASESVEDAVIEKGTGRLAGIDSDIEVVTVPALAVGKADEKADEKGIVLEEGQGNKTVVDDLGEAATGDIEQQEEGIANTGSISESLAGELPEVSEGKAPALPDVADEPASAEKVAEPPEREDNEIAKALEESEERKSDILIGLGFNKYDDNDGKIKYSILEDGIKIGVTFDEKNPDGYVWAIYHEDTERYNEGTSDEGKKGTFLSPVVKALQPLLQRYYAILKGDEPIPKPVVVGKVVERRGNSIGIEFEEEVGGPRTEYYPATDAVKRDKGGFFIARGFSKEWRDRQAKMHFPRVIRLPNYEQEFGGVPVSEPSGQQPSDHAPSSTSTTTPSPKLGASKAPTVTLEERRKQISDNLNWAMSEAVAVYKEHVEGTVPIDGDLGVFIEKIAVTVFMSLDKTQRYG